MRSAQRLQRVFTAQLPPDAEVTAERALELTLDAVQLGYETVLLTDDDLSVMLTGAYRQRGVSPPSAGGAGR